MIGRTRNDRGALDRLADALVEDILQASDADLLAEAEAGDENGEEIARAAFNTAATAAVKPRSRPVRKRTPYFLQTRTDVRALDPKLARRWLEEFAAWDPRAAGELTAAADEDGRLSDEDVYGALERLQECKAFERGQHPRPGRRHP